MTRVILMRHGQSEANLARWFAGHTDAHLTELGQHQAKAAAAYLFAHEQIDVIYASDLTRAMDTARPTAMAFSLPIIPEKGLREIFAGDWEGVPFSLLDTRFGADRALWHTDLAHARCTGGETIAQVFDRAVATVTRVARENDGKTILLATHWTPVLAMVCHAMGYGVDRIGECPEPMNASLQILRFEDGIFRPEALNILSHLDGIASHPQKRIHI
ncbi:MAG: histidine phosphatase family protein [Ruminococcaceae bacterium]|nr:histidine phosphatase family protein [Oscillospiraceae bacterium]